MSDPTKIKKNRGAYYSPFSGVGIELYPLGTAPKMSSITVHEVGYAAKNRNWIFPSVYSPFWRLYYNEKPGHSIVFNKKIIELQPEYFILIPERQLFHTNGVLPCPHFWISFSVDKIYNKKDSVPYIIKKNDFLLNIFKKVKKIAYERKIKRDRLYLYAQNFIEFVIEQSSVTWEEAPPEKITGVVSFIEKNYTKKIHIQDLADIAGISASGLFNKFKSHFGISPAAYIIQCRIRKAAELLQEDINSIEEIAGETGFPNRNYFTRIFIQQTGTSPAAFRKKFMQ
jgi:AraC-like DNA-binding protein